MPVFGAEWGATLTWGGGTSATPAVDSSPLANASSQQVVSGNRLVIDPVEWLSSILTRPGAWKAENTDGKVPVVVRRHLYRLFSMSRADLIIVNKPSMNVETQAITYGFLSKVIYLDGHLLTRGTPLHAELLQREFERCLMRFRKDSYGVANPNQGAVWVKEVAVEDKQGDVRNFYQMNFRLELHIEWEPIITQAEDLSGS